MEQIVGSDGAAEEQAVLDIKLPGRRRRASDDGDDTAGAAGEEADAAKLEGSDRSADLVDESETFEDAADTHHETESIDGGAERPGQDETAAATDGEETEDDEHEADEDGLIGAVEGLELEEDAADGGMRGKRREPFEVPQTGVFWLHDDRFGEEQGKDAAPETFVRKKAADDGTGSWAHDKFGVEDPDDDDFLSRGDGRGRSRYGGRGGGGRGGRTGRQADGDDSHAYNGGDQQHSGLHQFHEVHGNVSRQQPPQQYQQQQEQQRGVEHSVEQRQQRAGRAEGNAGRGVRDQGEFGRGGRGRGEGGRGPREEGREEGGGGRGMRDQGREGSGGRDQGREEVGGRGPREHGRGDGRIREQGRGEGGRGRGGRGASLYNNDYAGYGGGYGANPSEGQQPQQQLTEQSGSNSRQQGYPQGGGRSGAGGGRGASQGRGSGAEGDRVGAPSRQQQQNGRNPTMLALDHAEEFPSLPSAPATDRSRRYSQRPGATTAPSAAGASVPQFTPASSVDPNPQQTNQTPTFPPHSSSSHQQPQSSALRPPVKEFIPRQQPPQQQHPRQRTGDPSVDFALNVPPQQQQHQLRAAAPSFQTQPPPPSYASQEPAAPTQQRQTRDQAPGQQQQQQGQQQQQQYFHQQQQQQQNQYQSPMYNNPELKAWMDSSMAAAVAAGQRPDQAYTLLHDYVQKSYGTPSSVQHAPAPSNQMPPQMNYRQQGYGQ